MNRGKVAMVTGAAQGIGKQVALEAAADGARLTLVDRSPLVHEVAAEINKAHGQGQARANARATEGRTNPADARMSLTINIPLLKDPAHHRKGVQHVPNEFGTVQKTDARAG